MPSWRLAYPLILMPYPPRYNAFVVVGLAGTTAVASIVSGLIDGGAAYVLKASIFFAVLFGGVLWVAGALHPHSRFGAANQVTTLRAILAALAAGLVGHPVPPSILWWVIGLTVLMAILDGVDGWLARSTRLASAYGARLDMETDAAFILVLSVLVWQHEKAGLWVVACGLMRYGFVAAGRVLPWLARPLRTTRRGRIVAISQLLGLGVALAPAVARPTSAAIAGVTLAALVWSFVVDIAWLARSVEGASTVQSANSR